MKIFFKSALVLVLLALSSFYSCGYAERTTSKRMATGGLDLQVMTFNIRYGTAYDGGNSWINRRKIVFKLLQNQNADVVGLQEALKFQIDEILEAVPQYVMVGSGRDDGKTEGEYSAILYNRKKFRLDESQTFWLSDTPEVAGSITWGNACTRLCTWARLVDKKSSQAFYIYNTHLDHISQFSREKSAALLAQSINNRKHKDPFILTGDFNVGEDNAVINYLAVKTLSAPGSDINISPVPMVDTFRKLNPEASDVGTFNQFNGDCRGDKIDYILTEPTAEVLEAEILHYNIEGHYPSDHFPVTARLVFANKEPVNEN
jgi:endonuclease/exonuclease/phosphatase family metal-dependent hydrolase